MLTFNGCKKNDPTTGTIKFKNNEVDPYYIELDGVSQGYISSGATSVGFTVTKDVNHSCKATQKSGYILYPTVYGPSNVSVTGGGTTTWSF